MRHFANLSTKLKHLQFVFNHKLLCDSSSREKNSNVKKTLDDK